MPRDLEKQNAWKKRDRDRRMVAKYGPDAANRNMSGRHGNHARGEGNARWNGGIYYSTEGYVMRAVPEGHHLRQGHGYAYEHDLVAEEVLGRPLDTSTEIVHHCNGDRRDNRPENLVVETRSGHAREHGYALGARDEAGRFVPGVMRLRHNHGSDPDEWPDDLQVRQFPGPPIEDRDAALAVWRSEALL